MAQAQKTLIATIPFSGFYETLHASAIDDAFNELFSDATGDIMEALQNKAWRYADFSEARKEYAKEYAENFCIAFEIVGKYESMRSPKEYNFTTDTIHIELTETEAKRLFDAVDKEVFDGVCRDNLTSRSGFKSFYNPDFTQWGDVTKWDHNQDGTIDRSNCKNEKS